jgi:hypothetical protein
LGPSTVGDDPDVRAQAPGEHLLVRLQEGRPADAGAADLLGHVHPVEAQLGAGLPDLLDGVHDVGVEPPLVGEVTAVRLQEVRELLLPGLHLLVQEVLEVPQDQALVLLQLEVHHGGCHRPSGAAGGWMARGLSLS